MPILPRVILLILFFLIKEQDKQDNTWQDRHDKNISSIFDQLLNATCR